MNAIAVAAGPMPQPSPPGTPSAASLANPDLQAPITEALQTGQAQTAANLQQYFGQVAASLPFVPETQGGPSVWLWVALGLGVLLAFNVVTSKV
jgi:hypothetical protein